MNRLAAIVCALLWLVSAGAPSGRAGAGEIVMMSTDAIIDPIQAVHARAEQAIGRRVRIRWGSARGDLKDAILAGATFDVALLIPEVNEQLLQAGKIAGKGFEIARVNIAIGQRGSRPPVDVSTPAALKDAMVGAKALRWYKTGAALSTVNTVLDTLHVREMATAKFRLTSDLPLGPGEYELNFYPLSEILTRKDLRNLGNVVPELQVPASMTAVISAQTRDVAGARALIAFLQGPAIEPSLKASGFTR